MNQQIKLSQAIQYVIIGLALLIFLLIWPIGLIHETTISKSEEVVAQESEPISVEHNATQMFVAEGDNLSAVDLYVTNDMQGETITFRLYDASYTEMFNIFYVVKNGTKLPGFVHIPVDYELVKDQEYYYTLEGLTADLYVNYEDTYESTSIVNGILAYGGIEVSGYNIIARYEYTNALPWYFILLSAVLLGAIATGLYILTAKIFEKKATDKEIKVHTLFRIIGNPIIAVATVIMLYLVFPGRTFCSGIVNYIFYDLGILLLAAFLLYVLNSKRTSTAPFCTVEKIKDRVPDVLQAVCFASALWSCYEYWNGLFDITHAYATCKMLCWFLLAIITTYKKKELLNIINLIYLIVAVIGAYFYAKPYIGIEEQGELYKLQAYVIVIGGFVIINSIRIIINMIRKKEFTLPRISYLIMVIVLFAGMIVFRNTRTWTILTAVMIALFALRMCVWEKRIRLSGNFCVGILFNFIITVVFCLMHRPYLSYVYYRYGMLFHTVTVTAEYLTLIIGATIVAFLARNKARMKSDESNYIAFMWKELLLFGVAAVYMFLTLSRTGLFAVMAMLFVILILYMVTTVNENKIKHLVNILLVMLISFVISFPIVFTFTRTIPVMVNDPVRSELEEAEQPIPGGEPKNSSFYMSIERFMEVAGLKLFNQEEKQDSANNVVVEKISDSYASVDETNVIESTDREESETVEEDTQADFSNGRIELFDDYRKEWNLTGHTEMGVPMKNGEIAVHAHNSFLQCIHDFGLIVGLFIIIFGAMTFMFGANNFRNNWEKDMYTLLTPIVMVGFCAAGMAEWMYHICNPMGFALFISILPILFSKKEVEKKIYEK